LVQNRHGGQWRRKNILVSPGFQTPKNVHPSTRRCTDYVVPAFQVGLRLMEFCFTICRLPTLWTTFFLFNVYINIIRQTEIYVSFGDVSYWTSEMLLLEQRFVWCWNLDTSENISEVGLS
jgi:hypothetical protein